MDLTNSRKNIETIKSPRLDNVVDQKIYSGEVYGSCDINSDWKTTEDVQENLNRLPHGIREVILGSRGKSEKHQLESEFEKKWRFFLGTRTLDEKVSDVLRNGKEGVKQYLGITIFLFLNDDLTFFRQSAELLKRGVSLADIRDNFFKIFSKVQESKRAPLISIAELEQRRDDFFKEIDRLKQEIQKREAVVRDVKSRHETSKKKIEKSRLSDKSDKLSKTHGTISVWSGFSPIGYSLDLDKQIDGNLVELKRILDSIERAELMEKVLEKTNKMLELEDFNDIWLDMISRISEPAVYSVALDSMIEWHPKMPENSRVETENHPIDYKPKIDLLIKSFREVWGYINSTKVLPTAIANSVQQAQIILRKLLELISKQKGADRSD